MATYREFPVLYMIYDESNSWLSGANQARLASGGEKREAQNGRDPHGRSRGREQGHDGRSGQSGHGRPTVENTATAISSSGPVSAPTPSASGADGPINNGGNATV